jgi:hypothetical protein
MPQIVPAEALESGVRTQPRWIAGSALRATRGKPNIRVTSRHFNQFNANRQFASNSYGNMDARCPGSERDCPQIGWYLHRSDMLKIGSVAGTEIRQQIHNNRL